jgi:hypothetical protein
LLKVVDLRPHHPPPPHFQADIDQKQRKKQHRNKTVLPPEGRKE